jgi:hypothetical protein
MVLLLVVVHAFLTQSIPLQKQNVSGKIKFCGPMFSKALENVCAVYKSYWVTPTEGKFFHQNSFILSENYCCTL